MTLDPDRLEAARWIELPSFHDERGVLTAIESGRDIPFAIQRVYFLHQVTADRGGHAHRDTHQVITAVTGRCELALSDGARRRVFVLDRPTRGVCFGPMLFIEIGNFSPGAIALVLASTHYDKQRSIRSLEHYLEAIGGAR